MFPIQNILKQENALSLLLFKFRKFHQERPCEGRQIRIYKRAASGKADVVYLLDENVSVIKKNAQVLLVAIKEVKPEVTAEKTTCRFMFHGKKAGQNHKKRQFQGLVNDTDE